jgi:hypothetical protein
MKAIRMFILSSCFGPDAPDRPVRRQQNRTFRSRLFHDLVIAAGGRFGWRSGVFGRFVPGMRRPLPKRFRCADMKTSKSRLTGRSSPFTRLLVAQMAELVDAPASGAGTRKGVEVRVLFWAPNSDLRSAGYAIVKQLKKARLAGLFSCQLRGVRRRCQVISALISQASPTPAHIRKGQTMDETVAIESRSDFALWAIERAKEIVAQEGTALALAARDMDEEGLREAGHKLGGAISEALLEVFDGLLGQDDHG